MNIVYNHIVSLSKANKKMFAVLIDPDNVDYNQLKELILKVDKVGVDLIFVGGSILLKNDFQEKLDFISKSSKIPVVIFPGNSMQVSASADAILFLSLISGRNPEYLIGQQVLSAPVIKAVGLESISTGYILVDGGKQTSVSYMSNTTPIPRDKIDICVSTAIAGEMIGNKLIYLDGGSGAEKEVPSSMISKVKKNITIPLIVGGGLNTPEKVENAFAAGADIVVVGNALEKDPQLLEDLVFVSKKSVNENHCDF